MTLQYTTALPTGASRASELVINHYLARKEAIVADILSAVDGGL